MKNNFRFVISSPPYDPDCGGGIVLHRLCSLLRRQGLDAYLMRILNEPPTERTATKRGMFLLKRVVKSLLPFRQAPGERLPIIRWPFFTFNEDWIVIYPEIVLGNPLNAHNVARWFLHRPGFHSDEKFYYDPGEFHVDFNEFTREFSAHLVYRATNRLGVLRFPFEYYNQEGALPFEIRSGVAYCIRKGQSKPLVHIPDDAVLIDGKRHKDIAKIFKHVRTFISYDPYTAYSSFAVLCGAESIVIPDPDVPIEQWYENPAERYGVAYGYKDMERARNTAHLVLAHMQAKEEATTENVRLFAEEVQQYFALRKPTSATSGKILH